MQGCAESPNLATGSRVTTHKSLQAQGKKKGGSPDSSLRGGLLEPRIQTWLPPTENGLQMRSPQRGPGKRLALVGESSAALVVAFQAELADHAVQIAGERGQVLEGFDGLLCALRILDRQLRDLTSGLGDLAGGRCLLCGGGGDQVNLVLDLFG